MIRRVPVYQVDAFTTRAFRGNSAATCLLRPEHLPLSDSQRQLIAAEMNLSETAFVELLEPSGSFATDVEFNLRCVDEGNAAQQVTFHTQSGPLDVMRDAVDNRSALDATSIALSMRLPYIAPDGPLPSSCSSADSPVVKALCQDLKVTDLKYTSELKYLLTVCNEASAEELRALKPDVSKALKSCQDGSLVGVIVATLDSGVIYSRFFAPWAGIEEDPVTGSAHSMLMAYFSSETGNTVMEACQVSGRTGNLTVRVEGTNAVVLSSHATTVMQGSLLIPPDE